jgi:putative sugar O-methyltransferase
VNQKMAGMGPGTDAPKRLVADTDVKPIADDPELLALMMGDAQGSGPLWTATAYWRGYTARIMRELARVGLKNVRANQTLLKGFALGGIPQAELPQAGWKRAVWRMMQALPGVRQIIAEHQRVLAAEYSHHRQTRREHARIVMDEIADAFPDIRPPAGIANGGADDAFVWRGHNLTPAFTMYLSRAADFYTHVEPKNVTSAIEIGPGLGLGSLAHMTLNPGLRVIVNVDIIPVLYLSTQFLKSIDGVAVIDYRALRGSDRIVPEPAANGVRIYQLAPWQLMRVDGAFDFFFNAFSFQEMESAVCRNYAAQVLRLVKRGVLLHSMTGGHKLGAGGQKTPVTIEFLESLFQPMLPKVARVDGLWPLRYDGDAASTRLMTK